MENKFPGERWKAGRQVEEVVAKIQVEGPGQSSDKQVPNLIRDRPQIDGWREDGWREDGWMNGWIHACMDG